jgi:ABC-type dipeptide/oligopeptide/nickel transport system ATPase subunit
MTNDIKQTTREFVASNSLIILFNLLIYSSQLRFRNLGVHGRRKEIHLLGECLDRICDKRDGTTTNNELVSVAGYSGTGKSTLAETLQKPVRRKRGI